MKFMEIRLWCCLLAAASPLAGGDVHGSVSTPHSMAKTSWPLCGDPVLDSASAKQSYYFQCDIGPKASSIRGQTPPNFDQSLPSQIEWSKYPEHAKQMNLEGNCTVVGTVLPDGRVQDVEVVHLGGEDSIAFSDVCWRAMQNAIPVPATKNGVAIKKRTGIVIVWKLEQRFDGSDAGVNSICTKRNSSHVSPIKVDNTASLILALSNAMRKGMFADPCFYSDAELESYFGANHIDHYFDTKGGENRRDLIEVERRGTDVMTNEIVQYRRKLFSLTFDVQYSKEISRVSADFSEGSMSTPFERPRLDAIRHMLGKEDGAGENNEQDSESPQRRWIEYRLDVAGQRVTEKFTFPKGDNPELGHVVIDIQIR